MYDDDDYGAGGGGCLLLLLIGAIISWISDNWEIIVLVIVVIIAIAALITYLRSYEAKAPIREAEARAKAEKEAEEKRRKERESYDRYLDAQDGANLNGKLSEANEILRRLFDESDEGKRVEILAFFDKYLPLVTEIIEASKHGATDVDESLDRFTQTVKSFSKTLYKVDDVVDVNNAMMESMAIRDGYYDPYAEAFSLNAGEDTDSSESKSNAEEIAHQQIAENSYEVTEDDFDSIREMLDSGVISEYDIDDDVLEKVETYTF